jgi:hypothetical protein
MTEEKPPILKTWKNLYALVIVVLVILMVVFYLFTKHFK